MKRINYNFNTDWYFKAENDESVKEINLPHSNRLLPHHYFSEKDYQFVSWYRREFTLPEEYRNKVVLLNFAGVMSYAKIYINGEYVASHKGGYTPFTLRIEKFINFAEKNVLTIKVDSTRRNDIPPEGNLVDYLLFGGIYREVELIIVDPVYLVDTFFKISVIKQQAELRPEFTINNTRDKELSVELKVTIFDQQDRVVVQNDYSINLIPGQSVYQISPIILEEPELWTLENPYLYQAKVELKGNYEDQYLQKIGIRKVEFKEDGSFYLNNRPLKLRGLNRHQAYPYLGNAVGARMQKKDAEILKYELGLNFVRSAHYPAHPEFLNHCDEIGLLVFEELPGWQHIGDEGWQAVAEENLREMIIRDRNHPSIFIWGVRINESPDNHQFYLKTNQIAHLLDPTRPTGGVRNFRDSEFLEDVFTYNDFALNLKGKIKEPQEVPYMITEYMGHKFPTKAFDSTERLIKHALYHAQIQDLQYSHSNIAGACGWCAFDYNTHADFGSGNRICFHGVCDIYREPKFAAYFYKSQQSPDIKPNIFIARHLIPSFNEDFGNQVVVFSNCEEVELYLDDELHSRSEPSVDKYPGLPHPPFVFDDCNWWEWGAATIGSLKAIGKIAGQKVVEHEIFPPGKPAGIELKADYHQLVNDGSDLTRVVVRLVDQNRQLLHLANHIVNFEISGPADLIGENPAVLEAGRTAVFVRAKRSTGKVRLKATLSGYYQLQSEVEFEIIENDDIFVPKIERGILDD